MEPGTHTGWKHEASVRDSDEGLQPWRTSVGGPEAGEQTATPPLPQAAHRNQKLETESSARPFWPPSNLAKRMTLRQKLTGEAAEHGAQVRIMDGPFRLDRRSHDASRLPPEEKEFLTAKKVEGGEGGRMTRVVQCDHTAAQKVSGSAPRRVRTLEQSSHSKEEGSIVSNERKPARSDESASGTGSYVLQGQTTAQSHPWLKEMVQARSLPSSSRGIETSGMLSDPDEHIDIPVPAMPAGVPVILERRKVKQRNQNREKERGSLVEGFAMTLKLTSKTSLPQQILRRSLLKGAKDPPRGPVFVPKTSAKSPVPATQGLKSPTETQDPGRASRIVDTYRRSEWQDSCFKSVHIPRERVVTSKSPVATTFRQANISAPSLLQGHSLHKCSVESRAANVAQVVQNHQECRQREKEKGLTEHCEHVHASGWSQVQRGGSRLSLSSQSRHRHSLRMKLGDLETVGFAAATAKPNQEAQGSYDTRTSKSSAASAAAERPPDGEMNRRSTNSRAIQEGVCEGSRERAVPQEHADDVASYCIRTEAARCRIEGEEGETELKPEAKKKVPTLRPSSAPQPRERTYLTPRMYHARAKNPCPKPQPHQETTAKSNLSGEALNAQNVLPHADKPHFDQVREALPGTAPISVHSNCNASIKPKCSSTPVSPAENAASSPVHENVRISAAASASTMNQRTRPRSAAGLNKDKLEREVCVSLRLNANTRPASAPPKKRLGWRVHNHVTPANATATANIETKLRRRGWRSWSLEVMAADEIEVLENSTEEGTLNMASDSDTESYVETPLTSSQRRAIERRMESASDQLARIESPVIADLHHKTKTKAWICKKEVQKEILTMTSQWNSAERSFARLQEIATLEQHRQIVQTQIGMPLHDMRKNLRALVERQAISNESLCLNSTKSQRNTVDASFLWVSVTQSPGKGLVGTLSHAHSPQTFLHNRLHESTTLPAYTGKALEHVINTSDESRQEREQGQEQRTSPTDEGKDISQEDEAAHVPNKCSMERLDYSGTMSVADEEFMAKNEEPVDHSLCTTSAIQRGSTPAQRIQTPMSDVRDVVKGAKQKFRQNSTNVEVVYRSEHGFMSSNYLKRQEERDSRNDSWKNRGPATPLGMPVQMMGESEQLQHEQISRVLYRDLEAKVTSKHTFLHAACSAGFVHARPDCIDMPHSIVFTLDMAKTKGPIHKPLTGLSTRLLMVMLLTFEGDACFTVLPNTQSKLRKFDEKNSWVSTNYWGSLLDAGFDPDDEIYSSVLKGRAIKKAWWVIIDPDDPRYQDSHKIDLESVWAFELEEAKQAERRGQEGALAALVSKRRQIEDDRKNVRLADESIFDITVTGTVGDGLTCDFAIMARTLFRNDLMNSNLKNLAARSPDCKIFWGIKSSILNSGLRLRLGRYGVSIKNYMDKVRGGNDETSGRVHSLLFKPLHEQMSNRFKIPAKRYNMQEYKLRRKLMLKEEQSIPTVKSGENLAETHSELQHIWSSFVDINHADSSCKTLNFEQFYLLLFFMGLVASPDVENRLKFSEKRVLLAKSDVDVEWDKIYPLQRKAAKMDFDGFQAYFRNTMRRLKISQSEILKYKNDVTNRAPKSIMAVDDIHDVNDDFARLDPTTNRRSVSDDIVVNEGMTEVAQQAMLKTDGNLATQTKRVHPAWLGSFSASTRSAADIAGYSMQPLSMEDDFLRVEALGVDGVERSGNLEIGLSVNSPESILPESASTLPTKKYSCHDDEIASKQETRVADAWRGVQVAITGQNSVLWKAQQRLAINPNDATAQALLFCKAENAQSITRALGYFAPGVPPEDPSTCVSNLDLLGSGPVFVRTEFHAAKGQNYGSHGNSPNKRTTTNQFCSN